MSALLDHVPVADNAISTLIGGGGKTSTMLALSAQLQGDARRVLITTTTKIWPPADLPVVLGTDTPGALALLSSDLPAGAMGSYIGADGKLHGLNAAQVEQLADRGFGRAILCEADGAAGRPLKAHGEHEPVVPARTAELLIIIGLDAIGEALNARTAHRVERFQCLTGCEVGQVITPDHVATLLSATTQYAPPGATVTYIANKADDSQRISCSNSIYQRLLDLVPDPHLLATTRGRVVAAYGNRRVAQVTAESHEH